MQQIPRYAQERAHAALAVDAEHFQAPATVRRIEPAGRARAATDVRLDGALRARRNAPCIRRRADHFHAQLVSENAWIGEEGLASGEGVQIGSAYADAVNSHQRLALTGGLRSGELFLEITGLFEYNLSHQSDGSSLGPGLRKTGSDGGTEVAHVTGPGLN